ncbi:hypothetical protein HaLaN_32732, partial [Haematococcus lacustris]
HIQPVVHALQPVATAHAKQPGRWLCCG